MVTLTRRPVLALGFVLAAAVPSASVYVDAHPLHVSVTEISHDAAARRLSITVRVFADDFLATIGLPQGAGGAGADTALVARTAFPYVSRAISLRHGRSTQPLRMNPCGVRLQGEALLICAEVPAVTDPRGITLHNSLLLERFADQLNVVRVVTRGRSTTHMLNARNPVAAFR